jgi:hypothetical protein
VQEPSGCPPVVWFQNFAELFKDTRYLESFSNRSSSASRWRSQGIVISLVLAAPPTR